MTRVGSKLDSESVLLGELATALVRSSGTEAIHRRELGGTPILWQSLLAGEIDIYPEFTGTLAFQTLNDPSLSDFELLKAKLQPLGIGVTEPLGYENNYAIGVRKEVAERLQIACISDLIKYPNLQLRFTAEFVRRADGWPALKQHYGLPHADPDGIDHALAYRGIENGTVDVLDVYTTEAEIVRYDVRVLDDDRKFFPRYAALFLYRLQWANENPQAVTALRKLERLLDESTVRRLNAATQNKVSESTSAANFLKERLQIEDRSEIESEWSKVLRHTGEHLRLVAISLSAAILVGIPLGIVSARQPRFGQVILGITGLIQTIPSLALLVFLVAVPSRLGGGLGWQPAVIALFLYSLLPIVRNTLTGLNEIPPSLREAADAIGLSPGQKLRQVELPMASRSILAGIKTAAVINIGTATLGALIDAGGLGVLIQQGLRINDTRLILLGAVPSAGLALAAQFGFELLERLVVPRGLRLTSTE